MNSLLKDLNWKFAMLASFLIVGVMLAEQSLLMKQARIGMESRLSEKAVFINTFYASVIADALQRKDDVTLLQVINRLEEDPEITSVVVVDGKGEVRYHVDSDKLGTVWGDPLTQKTLQTNEGTMEPFRDSGGRALTLVSPLKLQGAAHPIGAVKIDFTYSHVRDQLSKFDTSFRLAVIGFISTAVGLMMIFVRRWVIWPVELAEKTVSSLHLTTAEPSLPETSDEFGRMNKAINDMILRFRSELQEQLGAGVVNPGELEKGLAEKLMRSFAPEGQVIIADKNNRIMSHTNGGVPVEGESVHLLDLLTDPNFATLVGTAYQSEGNVVRGPVLFQDQPYEAAVLCVPDSQSKAVKTVIALQTTLQKGAS